MESSDLLKTFCEARELAVQFEPRIALQDLILCQSSVPHTLVFMESFYRVIRRAAYTSCLGVSAGCG